ncbi:putative methyltransferase NSUN6 isoform X3 [Olea europaea var. sylvestris]|uniref:putative methyltransferase NSUN6 isoform X3 n=1 Tax=Olea europaea var. sylvestris TaxID=158386 RepID=UPI000C1D3035|nr:putative methyltransferase NSUN6 isoform X3 [Olea europaea var. sylvestris]
MKEGVFLKTLCRTLLTRHPRKPNSPLHLQMDRLERYCYNPTLRWNPQVEEYFIKAYGADYFHRISTALTRPSCYSCIRVNTLQSTTGDVIEKLLAILQERRQQNGSSDGTNVCHISDDLAKATLGSSETILPNKSVQDCFIEKCQIPSLDYVVFVKGSGPHTIDYGHIANKPPKEVVVSRKCAEAVLRGAQVYVPGVLACSAHVEKGEVVAVSVAVEQPSSTGGWGVGFTRGTILQGSQTDPYYFERKGLYIGQGTTVMSRAGIFRASEGVAVDMVHRIYKLPSFRDILEGEIFLQNLPSIITAHALDPQEGERILDMCAAPGGKTTAIAILMKDKGEVIAVDRSHNKVHLLNLIGGLEQMGNESHISKAELRKNNRKLRNGPGRNNCLGGRVEKSKGFPPNSFDRVLLDAPCSALGLRPRLFAGEETMESLRTHAKYQRRMFDQAVQLVRPGGVIVYSTCTINPGENEALVRYALDTYKFLSLASQFPRVGGPGLVGGYQFSDEYKEEWLRHGEEDLVQRFDPSSPLDTIGFFIAKFSVGSKDV